MTIQIEKIAALIAEKTTDRLASLHIDASGLIRLGDTKDDCLKNFNRLLGRAESLGGNFMVPTYSYSFSNHLPFNRLETPSEVGMVTEFLRTKNRLKRTVDGMFSYLLFNNDPSSSYFDIGDGNYEIFGDASLIGELFKSNGYICSIGNIFHNTPTEVHFLERLLAVPYRHNKTIVGQYIDEYGKHHDQTLVFFCRDSNQDLVPDMTRLETCLRDDNLFEYWQVEDLDFQIEAVHMNTLLEILRTQVQLDPLFLCSTSAEKKRNWRERQLKSRYY